MKTQRLLKQSQILSWVLALSLIFAQPAQARLVDSADSTNYSFQGEVVRVWREVKKETREVVNRWTAFVKNKIAAYKGESPTPTAAPVQPTPQQPSERAVASAGQGAAVVSPIAPTNGITPIATVPINNGVAQATASPGGSAVSGATAAPSAATMVVAAAPPQPGAPTPASSPIAKVAPAPQLTAPSTPLMALPTATQQVKNILATANPGRVGTTKLAKTKQGVPTLVLKGVKKISRLDIGLERSIQARDLTQIGEIAKAQPQAKVTPLESPKLHSQKDVLALKSKKLETVTKAKSPKAEGGLEIGKIVTSKKIEDVPLAMDSTKQLAELKPFQPISDEMMNMILAVSLINKGDKCHMASGLLSELSKTSVYAEEANFLLGICAHQMGFHSEAVSRLLKVVEAESPEFVMEAVTNLVEDLPREYDDLVAPALRKLKRPTSIEEKARDNVNYVLARASHEQGQYAEAVAHAVKVSDKSTKYREARYILGIAQYATNKQKEAEQTLLALRDWMTKKDKIDKNIEALIAVNLARIRFVQNRYQAAYEEYMQVPKDNPLWVQALIEQGWAQLSIDDPAGAIGNMYSLHSPYFKSVFIPESWVIRTIGYIDICQYGDAYRTLSKLEQLYGGWSNSVVQYLKNTKNPDRFYATVKNYLRGRSDQNVDGLPYQVIREVARQRGFLNAQNAINGLEDEAQQYKYIYKMVKADQADVDARLVKAKQRLDGLKASMKKAAKSPELAKNLPEWTEQAKREAQLIDGYTFLKSVYARAQKGFLKMSAAAFARIDGAKDKLRTEAGRALSAHLRDVQKRVAQIIEGNEFLRYEIFAGSGENIRYQVSGGTTSDAKRVPSNVKPEKITNWEFDGEYWEDEIGSYRSTLKNNCPKNARTAVLTNDGDSALPKTAKKD